MIIQIIGQPKTGKTALGTAISERINSIYLDGEVVKKTVNKDLKISYADRAEHSRRLGEIARLLNSQNHNVIVDFVCPTKEIREEFGKADILVWVNRKNPNYEIGINHLWDDPEFYDLEIKEGLTVDQEVELVLEKIREMV